MLLCDYDIVCLVWNTFIIFGKRTHLKLGKVIYCFRMDCVQNLNTFHLSEDSLCVGNEWYRLRMINARS